MVSTLTSLKLEMGRTTGGGADSVISSCEGAVTWLSVAGSGSDRAGVGSEGVGSVVSTTSASFGTSASYMALIRTRDGLGMEQSRGCGYARRLC